MRERKIVDVWVFGVLPYPREEWKNLIKKEVAKQVKDQINKRLSVKLEFFLRYNRMSRVDIDNIINIIFNSLSQGPKRLLANDYLIDHVEATKIRVSSPNDEKTHIQIWEWKFQESKEQVRITPLAQVENEQLTDEQILARISEVLSYKTDPEGEFAQSHPFIVHSRLFVYYRHNTESIKEEYRKTYKNNFSRIAEYRDILDALRTYMHNFRKADFLQLCIYNAKTDKVETLSTDNAQIHRILAIQ